jgi:FkbM family methyltransferase
MSSTDLNNKIHTAAKIGRFLQRFRALRPQTGQKSVVFAGCARDVAKHLPGVLANIEQLSRSYERCAFIFVENDSIDATADILKEWLSGRSNGHLLQHQNLSKQLPKRTERLAYARNSYINFISKSRYRGFDQLVILDFDEVNTFRWEPSEIRGAIDFLENTPDAVGVFANSLPVYYDIWALRQKDWCPTDCWVEQRADPNLTLQDGINRFVRARQRFLPGNAKPVRVTSAFGGLGIMNLAAAIKGHYQGIYSDGNERCEHVPFNEQLAKQGHLYVFPGLHVQAPSEHLDPKWHVLGNSRELVLSQNNNRCEILAPSEHPLEKFRSEHPLYDRRLPLLSALVTADAPGTSMIDVGANLGDTAALCRLAGCELDIFAVEPSNRYYNYLLANIENSPNLFRNVFPVQAFIGNPGERLTLVEERGTAFVRPGGENSFSLDHDSGVPPTIALNGISAGAVSLVKIDTDGYDASIILSNIDFITRQQPIIWAEADTSSETEERAWPDVLLKLSESYGWVCAFDNFGFLVTHGSVLTKRESIIDMIDYCRRQKAANRTLAGAQRIFYLDVAFFPRRFEGVYRDFVSSLFEVTAPALQDTPQACMP